jgi:transposase
MKRIVVAVTAKQREELEAIVARRSSPTGVAARARIVLLTADGFTGAEIAERLDVSQEHVSRTRARYCELGVAGLQDRPKAGRKDHAITAEQEREVLDLVLSPPPAGRSRWTTRLLGRALELSSLSISRILRAHDIKPHLKRTYKVSRDPEFTSKVNDVVGLYLNPPHNAVVLSVDEKTQVQALERTQLPLPLREGRAVRHTHDYRRHGVVDLYAALNIDSGHVTHACKDRHTGADFLSFMKQVAKRHPRVELHVILDNSSTHGTPEVQTWLAKNPRIHFHYTPTSASWLNQVEGFFGILTKQSLSLTNFPSKKALRDHLEAYIAKWNTDPTPFVWTKPAAAIIRSHRKMLDRISGAVH